MSTPRQIAQQEAALSQSIPARVRAGEIHQQLKSGEVKLDQVITESALRNKPVRAVLGWQRYWGAAKVSRAMAVLVGHAYGNPLCRELTPRQIAVLVELVNRPISEWADLAVWR